MSGRYSKDFSGWNTILDYRDSIMKSQWSLHKNLELQKKNTKGSLL